MSRISRSLRYQILRRDNHTCRYCGSTAPESKIVVDHVTPQALGGTNDPGNLVTACADCNSGKAATPADAAILSDVSADALRWARARETAAEKFREDNGDRVGVACRIGQYWQESFGPGAAWGGDPIPDHLWMTENLDIFSGVFTWIDHGLTEDDLTDIIDNEIIVRGRTNFLVEKNIPLWKYFASLCWKRVRLIDSLAMEMVQSEGSR